MPAEFHLQIPSRKLLYLAGVAREDLNRVRAANTLIELPTGDGGVGWLGHLAAEVEDRWFVDSSFDQAFFAFAEAGKIPHGQETPQIAVLDLAKPLGPEFSLEGKGAMEDDSDVLFTYRSLADPTFAEQPAWELDHLQPAIGRIVRRMNRFLGKTRKKEKPIEQIRRGNSGGE